MWSAITFAIEVALSGLLVWWFHTYSRHRKLPWRFSFVLLTMGALSAFLAAYIQTTYSLTLELLPYSLLNHPSAVGILFILQVFVASSTEELAKYLVAALSILNSRRLKTISEGIFYLVVIGLGFSLAEDALYLLNPEVNPFYRLVSFYLHSGTSAMVGYYLGRYSFGTARSRTVAWGLLQAILLHTAYNLTILLGNTTLTVALTLLTTVFITIQVFQLYRRSLVEEVELERINRPKTVHLLNM